MRFDARTRRLAALLALALLATACASGRRTYRQGVRESKRGNWDLAVARITRAVEAEPDNLEYRLALDNARAEASRAHTDKALEALTEDDLDKARDELEIAVKFDAANRRALDQLASVGHRLRRREAERQKREELAEPRTRPVRLPTPVLSPRSTAPITLKFNDTSLQKIFESLGKLAGVNIVFDPDFRDKKISFDVTGITFEQALDQLTLLHRLFYKVLDQNTIVLAPESPQKRRSYDDLLVQTFYLRYTETKEITAVVKGLLTGGSFKVVENPTLGAITVTGTPDQVALAQRIIEANDKPRGEVLIELRIMEVRTDRARKFGIDLANYTGGSGIGGITFAPQAQPADVVDVRAHMLSSVNLSDFVVTLPARVFARLEENRSITRILAAPRLRASEGKKTSLKIGTEIAVPTTTFTTPAAGTNTYGPATSFSTRNVGVNLEMTPKISAGGEITLEVAAEFSALGGPRPVAQGLTIDDILTRNVSGILRLRDGETTLIGGLRAQTDASSTSGVMGAIDIPILNKIFGSKTSKHEESEVVISMTPRIVRAPVLEEEDLRAMPIGTDEVKKVPGARQPLLGLGEPEAKPETKPEAKPGAASPKGPPEPAASPRPGPPPSDTPTASTRPGPPSPDPGAGLRPGTALPEPPARDSQADVGPVAAGPVALPVRAQFAPQSASVKAGEVGAVSVVVLGAQDLTAVELALTFDAAVIEPVDMAPGALLTLDGSAVGSEKQGERGRYRARFTRQLPTSGAGAVAVFTFRGLKPGDAALGLGALSLTMPAGAQTPEAGAAPRVTVVP